MNKLVHESLNEYVSHDEDRWADSELDRWEMKQKGIDPFNAYVKKVVKIIYDNIPEDVLKYTGVTDYIIHDLITSPADEGGFTRDVYDYYEDHVPEEAAAMDLGLEIENYVAGSGDDMN
jgi:hypothetical protein